MSIYDSLHDLAFIFDIEIGYVDGEPEYRTIDGTLWRSFPKALHYALGLRVQREVAAALVEHERRLNDVARRTTPFIPIAFGGGGRAL